MNEKEIYCLSTQSSSQMYPRVILNSFSETTCKKESRIKNDGCAFIKTSIAIKDSRSPTGWLVPGNIEESTPEDLQLDAAIQKAKESGLTNEDISILMNGMK